MTTRTLALTHPARAKLAGIAGFAGAVALAAQVAIPLPGTPVPLTLQPLAVVLAGLWLGPAAGALSMILYLSLGTAGLPVFAPVGPPGVARLLGPTGGFLLAYPVAAWVAGTVARRGIGFSRRLAAAAAGIGVLYVDGVAQLAVLTGDVGRAVALGAAPFIWLDAIKAVIAAWMAPRSAPTRRG